VGTESFENPPYRSGVQYNPPMYYEPSQNIAASGNQPPWPQLSTPVVPYAQPTASQQLPSFVDRSNASRITGLSAAQQQQPAVDSSANAYYAPQIATQIVGPSGVHESTPSPPPSSSTAHEDPTPDLATVLNVISRAQLSPKEREVVASVNNLYIPPPQ
jgi:hypothetical protein